MVRRELQDNKVPGPNAGTRVAPAPGLAPTRSATGLMGESQVNSSLPCQTRFEQPQEETWLLEVAGRGIRMETMDASLEELRVGT